MTPPADDHYDVIVLGAGSGGYVAAIRAAQLGMSVGIVEERYWGGVCLNTGCVPSKALLRNAEIASIITHGSATFGISGDVNLDYSRAVSRSREVAEARVRGVHFLMRKNNITEIDGHGYFTSPHNLHIDLGEGGSRLLSFDHAVIATGSRVRMLPGVALSDNIVTYEQQILSADLPESIVIIGGGTIGMEFAYILHSYGVRVEMLEFADRVLPNEDPDVSRELQRHYRRRGITIHTSTRVDKVIDHGEHVVVSHTGADGTSATAQAARAFICIGFCPNVEGSVSTPLECVSPPLALSTSTTTCARPHPHIYAIGDVTAKVQLAHVASAQGVVAAETIAGVETMPLDYPMMPRVTFCQPQVASFGYTEEQARAAGHRLRVATFPCRPAPRPTD